MLRLPALTFSAAALVVVPGCTIEPREKEGQEAASNGKIAVDEIDAAVMAARLAAGEIVLVDVRTPEEFAEGHIEGAVNMPLDSFNPTAVPEEDGKETVLYCRSGRRSELAAEYLAEATGVPTTHLEGGIIAWEEAGERVVTD